MRNCRIYNVLVPQRGNYHHAIKMSHEDGTAIFGLISVGIVQSDTNSIIDHILPSSSANLDDDLSLGYGADIELNAPDKSSP